MNESTGRVRAKRPPAGSRVKFRYSDGGGPVLIGTVVARPKGWPRQHNGERVPVVFDGEERLNWPRINLLTVIA